MAQEDQKEKGQVAYEAYREACPVSKFTGDKLPLWADIDPELKPYWTAVEAGVLAYYGDRDPEELRRLFDGGC